MSPYPTLAVCLLLAAPLTLHAQEAGLAAKYPGDRGLSADPAVILVEDFEQDSVEAVSRSWSHTSNLEGKAMALEADVPPGTAGKKSLRVTATRGQDTGGHLFKVLERGQEQLHIRFYVKFAEDHGFLNHFVKLQGSVNPPRWPEGEAGYRHTKSFSIGLEPMGESHHTYPGVPYGPPGIWHFYNYWPEMHSHQTPQGEGTRFYGNNFEPLEPAVVPRGKWQCVEFMVKLNSTPEATDGEQAFWIDGKLAARFAPGSVSGHWMRDKYRLDPKATNNTPFPGFRWRTDPDILINKVWLLYYLNFEEGTARHDEKYAAEHPDTPLNTQSGTVWFDDVVVATKYIGPVTPVR
jgi:hypothetical protein